MRRLISNCLFYFTIALLLVNCANRGNPSGGPKDETPPVIIKSEPDNLSTNFNGKEIKIYFDEYIKIKDIQKQLIISPPMDPPPEITPLGSASKYITIRIVDTLEANTTYALNFGESIVDNNESNPYPYYRYVFSTGSYIDSLSVNGVIEDALDRKTEEFVSVMLYEMDSTYTDSIVYKEKPKYITNTLDSVTSFQLNNLKAGKYMMVALKDANSNYTFQQKTDKIGFKKTPIVVPTDTSYVLKLFKENINFRAARPKQIAGNKIAFGYDGDYENMKINILSQTPTGYDEAIFKDPKTDTLLYWYKPNIKTDSLLFEVANNTYSDTLVVKVRDQEKDSLTLKMFSPSTLKPLENLEITGNTPLRKLNEDRITIFDKDSVNVDFTTSFDQIQNTYKIQFDKTESNNYKVRILPDGITDFFEQTNDTLNYIVKTKSESDYGNLRLTLQNAVYPVIVQLIDAKGEIKAELFTNKSEPLDFRHLDSGNYYIRTIMDANNNKVYDTGNYLKKIQPERVLYYPTILEIRVGWDYVETFILN